MLTPGRPSDVEDLVVMCPAGARLFVAEVPLTLRRGPVIRHACPKCRYAVWRYGLGGRWSDRSIHEKDVLVEHRVDSVSGDVIGTSITIWPVSGDNRPGKGGTPVRDSEVLLRQALAAWSAKPAAASAPHDDPRGDE